VREIADHGQTNLMIWNAAIYCTRVERDPFVVAVRCTLVYLFGSWNTLVQAAAPQCRMGERERNEELCV
jgi:hypothetical protein